ncbi:hypothetical protein [Demetria terragena]|uniref:hypothetical protein n=1 Tax=Demetria terragena TaxID=63959 RepID=UPI00035ED372|nr:hypothetical protein [Demetria terragena]
MDWVTGLLMLTAAVLCVAFLLLIVFSTKGREKVSLEFLGLMMGLAVAGAFIGTWFPGSATSDLWASLPLGLLFGGSAAGIVLIWALRDTRVTSSSSKALGVGVVAAVAALLCSYTG